MSPTTSVLLLPDPSPLGDLGTSPSLRCVPEADVSNTKTGPTETLESRQSSTPDLVTTGAPNDTSDFFYVPFRS